jgi:hypothetical protein
VPIVHLILLALYALLPLSAAVVETNSEKTTVFVSLSRLLFRDTSGTSIRLREVILVNSAFCAVVLQLLQGKSDPPALAGQLSRHCAF